MAAPRISTKSGHSLKPLCGVNLAAEVVVEFLQEKWVLAEAADDNQVLCREYG